MSEQEKEIQQPVDTSPPTPEFNSGVIRQTMDLYLQSADQIEQSPEEYKRESYARAMSKITEVEFYIENGVITRDEGNKIIAGEWAQTEIDGLIDPVTFSLNKKGFEARLQEFIIHARRTQEAPLTVAYFDLVGFKKVNDLIGHNAGDRVLLYFADFLRSHARIREDDFVSRIGGDEFMAAFPLADETVIREKLNSELLGDGFAQYVRQRMADDGISHQDTYVSSRVGITSLRENDTVEALKGRADEEMNAQRDPNSSTER